MPQKPPLGLDKREHQIVGALYRFGSTPTTRAVFAMVFITVMWRSSFGQHSKVVSEKNNRNEAATKAPAHEMVMLPIRVVDADGEPVVGAEVIPWALRCSQGHGQWRVDGFGESEPPKLMTDAAGWADVPYPRYAVSKEQVRTTEVTLHIDHSGFAYNDSEYIEVPRTEQEPHTIMLARGALVEIVPLQDGKPAPLEGLNAMWSDGRVWKPGVSPTSTADGALRIPRMPSGTGQVLLVRLDGERATHFSPIIDLKLEDGTTVRERAELRPAIQIKGTLSENVPRPIKNGRMKARILPTDSTQEHVFWETWVSIQADGTFAIDAWPAGEAVQIIALCDGYIAESGEPPAVVKKKPRVPDSFYRPQVFSPQQLREPITLLMSPTIRCAIETADAMGKPIVGVKVSSYPNVGWWNFGSQIYCSPLVRGETLLVGRDYRNCADHSFSTPFEMVTDSQGHGELELPVGMEGLVAEHDDFELPVVRGGREQRIQLVAGQTSNVHLVLQPKGTEHLGEWDKLAGVLFGCTGEQCRRLLSDPGFRQKMEVVRKQLEDADDPTNPILLSSAYGTIAEAFDDLEDKEEAVIWRRKADEQAAKLLPSGSKKVAAPKH